MLDLYSLVIATFQENPLAQAIGFFAVAVNIIAFIATKDKKFLIFMAISSCIRGIHFGLMGLYSAAGVSFLDIVKNISALKFKNNAKIMLGFLVAYLIIGYFTFDPDNLFSLIPILNALLSIYFIFYLKGVSLKTGFLMILILWFMYNYHGHSLGGMLSDGILFISGCIGLYRLIKDKKSD